MGSLVFFDPPIFVHLLLIFFFFSSHICLMVYMGEIMVK